MQISAPPLSLSSISIEFRFSQVFFKIKYKRVFQCAYLPAFMCIALCGCVKNTTSHWIHGRVKSGTLISYFACSLCFIGWAMIYISFCNTVIKEIDAYLIVVCESALYCTWIQICGVWYQNYHLETKFSFKGNLHWPKRIASW